MAQQTEAGPDPSPSSGSRRPTRPVLIGAAAVLVVLLAAGAGSVWYFTRSGPVATPTTVDELGALLIRDRAAGDADVRTHSLEQWANRPELLPRMRADERDKLRREGFRWHAEMAWDTAEPGRRRVELTQYATAAQAADQVDAFRAAMADRYAAEPVDGQPAAYVLDHRDPALRGQDYVHGVAARGTILVLVSTMGTQSTDEVRGLLVDQLDRLP